jgi:hypothetical protein
MTGDPTQYTVVGVAISARVPGRRQCGFMTVRAIIDSIANLFSRPVFGEVQRQVAGDSGGQ